ncbi:MAG: MiaB/RimO family radical SAM methylthiotransferase [Candidatus Omnitrophica bacterium]|nr:MiaB/RimO family radical SAM methylthiotransferase [Candidatus Omnitrophota bacterium]
MAKKTFSIISLGCFRNTYDSEVMVRDLLKAGYRFSEKADKVDTLVVNTCGFITQAKEESLETIRGALDLKRKGRVKKVIIRGCLVARYRQDLEKHFPDIDEWGIFQLFPAHPQGDGRPQLTPGHIAFLKIAEGCSHGCSYCAIPLIKGKFRSRSESDILREASLLDTQKIKEVNIIGQDVTSWGSDFKTKKNLVGLLKKIIKGTGHIRWFRLLYTHPTLFSDEFIEFIAHEPRMCKYIDLPIQHVNDRILKLMNRRTTKKDIVTLLEKIRKNIPGVAIRTSLIVGFPGETEKEFRELVDFVRMARLEHVGVFTFSREEQTPAYNLLGQVHHRTRERRQKELLAVQQEVSAKVNRNYVGKRMDILIDEKRKAGIVGRTEHQCFDVDGVVYVQKKEARPGRIYRLMISDSYEYDLVAG